MCAVVLNHAWGANAAKAALTPGFSRCLCTGCIECWRKIQAGDIAGATAQCPSGAAAGDALDVLIQHCLQNGPEACDFWQQRCDQVPQCQACMSAMGGATSLSGIVQGSAKAACHDIVRNIPAFSAAGIAMYSCPSTTSEGCRAIAFECVTEHAPLCAQCLNGTASAAHAATCDVFLHHDPYNIASACVTCPETISLINKVIYGQSAVGAVSVVACLTVTVLIVAHGRDRVSMRVRIILGLVLTNAVYSSANVIPLNLLQTGAINCGRLALSSADIRFGRAWWLCGKCVPCIVFSFIFLHTLM